MVREPGKDNTKNVNNLIPPYTIHGTKKCSIPINILKKRGHDVTVIKNISGNITLLAKELKKVLGCNACCRDINTIEIQGHHLARVEKFLITKGCFKGVKKSSKSLLADQINKEDERKLKKKQLKKEKDSKDVVKKGKLKKQNNNNNFDLANFKKFTRSEVSKMKPKMLKQYLKTLTLSTQGNKNELADRLYSHVNDSTLSSKSQEEEVGD